MGQWTSRYREQGIPVYVSINGSIVETYELRPLKVIKPRFNAQYSLNYFRFEPPNIIIGYPGIPHFNCGLILDRENTFKEGHTLNITFRVRDPGPSNRNFREIFEWHPDLTCISIKLLF
jgi:hypothetical protein